MLTPVLVGYLDPADAFDLIPIGKGDPFAGGRVAEVGLDTSKKWGQKGALDKNDVDT